MSINWWMHKQTGVSIQLEYYSAIKRNELQIDATTLMNLKRIMLSERSQSQKTTYCMISFIRHGGKGKTIGTKMRLVAARGWWWEKGIDCKQKCSRSQMWWWLRSYMFAKTHQTVYLKRVNFIKWKLYLNKSDLRKESNTHKQLSENKHKKNQLTVFPIQGSSWGCSQFLEVTPVLFPCLWRRKSKHEWYQRQKFYT